MTKLNLDVVFDKKKAALTTVVVADCLKLSRSTVSAYKNGRKSPHHLLTSQVQAFVDAVTKAVKGGDLPIPRTYITREEQQGYLQEILKTHARLA